MRASEEEQTGGAGISEVSAAFERIGWGTAENARHDLGTDLFLQARDARLFDVGLVVGAQVKAGESYFREPEIDAAGEVVGWWYRDTNRSHVDDWAQHGLPHLIVLHDLETRTSYWRHVTAESIVPTGKGAKLLVPRANTVDQEHREELLAVAATKRPRTAWEGTVWTGGPALAPRDLLRHALIAPRLVAPHPNAGHGEPITPYQAVALLAQARLRDLRAFAEQHETVPTLRDTVDSPDWLWRYVGALGRWLTREEMDGLLAVIGDAPSAETRAAATVSAACALLELARPDEAVELLQSTLARDDARPADHAWLQAQHARACAEIGRIDDARAEAASVQAVRSSAPDDVTASAVAGAAAILLFNTAQRGQHDVGEVIAGGDTAASWWRTQTASQALNALADRAFKDWGRSGEVVLAGADVVNDQLVAAAFVANHAADHGACAHLLALHGRDALLRLDRTADPEDARRGLTALRRAGDDKGLALAVRQLSLDGPASAVALAAAEIDLDRATRTTGPADLGLLQHGGDLLDGETANRTLEWLLTTLDDPARFVERTTPSYLVEIRLLETLAALVPALDPRGQRAVIDRVTQLPAEPEQLFAQAWARVVVALPDDAWTGDTALAAAEAAESQLPVLRGAILKAAARYDAEMRGRLEQEARDGSLDALAAFGNLSELSHEGATEIIERLADGVTQQVDEAHAGARSFGGDDPGHALTLLNVWHPAAAKWQPLLTMLSDDAVWPRAKRGALEAMLGAVERMPEETLAELRPIVVSLASKTRDDWADPFDTEQDVRGPATCIAVATDAVDDAEATDLLLDLLASGPAHRRWAAELARHRHHSEDIGLLLDMITDQDPSVRGAAAMALAWLVARSLGGTAAMRALERCLEDPGTQVPASVAATLADSQPRSADRDRLLARLRDHPSAVVRGFVAGADR